MDLLNGLSSDQTAVIGCAAALLISGTVMSLSYYVGRFLHGPQESPEPSEPRTLKLGDHRPGPVPAQDQRRAA